MNDELISQVEELGLSNKEARVYIANLMLGPAGVQQIADTSGIKRVTTYVILEALVNLGLVSQTNKTKKTLFNAEAPENLRRLLEKREQSVREQKQQLEELLPELHTLKTLPDDAPSVKFYEGVEGLRTLMRDYITSHSRSDSGNIYGMSNMDVVNKIFPEIEEKAVNPDRLRAQVPSKFLYTSNDGPYLEATDKETNRESRYLPPSKFPFTSDITIVGNSVVLMSLGRGDPIAVTIQSREIAQGFRVLFDLAWQKVTDAEH